MNTKLVISNKHGDFYIPQINVLYVCAKDGGCEVHYIEGNKLLNIEGNKLLSKKVSKSLTRFVEENNCPFLRIGQDCFVNPIHVQALLRNRTLQFYHPDAPTVIVSRKHYPSVRKALLKAAKQGQLPNTG